MSVYPQCDGAYGVVATVRNIGEAVLPPDVPICFFEGVPPTVIKGLGCAATTLALFPAQAENVFLPLSPSDTELTSGSVPVYAVVGALPVSHECRTDNNTSAPVFAACKP